MRLKRFSISNYRSIKSTPRISVDHNLTIVGPNNEGKSNIVRAIVTALRILEEHGARRTGIGTSVRLDGVGRFIRRDVAYDWSTDCHVSLQKEENAASTFYLEFQLNNDDMEEFYAEIGSSINGFLPIEITVARSGLPMFEVKKQGKAKAFLQDKSADIARFVGSKLSINHIPAIRTADEAIQAVSTLAATSLRRVQRLPEYVEALDTLERIQKPLYDELEQQLSENLKRFLPSIKDVSLGITASSAARALRSVDILIDDGQYTPLKNKGDGVISLVGMALLARLKESSGSSFNTILAIEEPESHLHPRAIHGIRDVLDNIGADYQVIVTTHSPLLVDRLRLSSNIIVENSQARVSSDISEIRSALGVRVADNLSHARVVIVCEGADDQRSLTTLLCGISSTIELALRTAEVSFYPLLGSGNLSYVVGMLQQSISEPICFLDDDQSGHEAAKKAISDNLITDDACVFSSVLGKTESELEDLIDQDLIGAEMLLRFKVDMRAIPAGIRKQKFSERCKAAFIASGRTWNEGTKVQAKALVADLIERSGPSVLAAERKGPVERLRLMLEEKLNAALID